MNAGYESSQHTYNLSSCNSICHGCQQEESVQEENAGNAGYAGDVGESGHVGHGDGTSHVGHAGEGQGAPIWILLKSDPRAGTALLAPKCLGIELWIGLALI